MTQGMLIAILGANAISSAIIGLCFMWGFHKVHNTLKALTVDVKSVKNKIDNKSIENRIDADSNLQTQRTDQLYQMFIDLLKEQKGPKTNP